MRLNRGRTGFKSYKGKFAPKFPQKYKGNSSEIYYRSLLELRAMRHLDQHPDVLSWSSEEVIIPYRSPIDNRIHRYFPDMYALVKQKNGDLVEYLIEIKPQDQTTIPKLPKSGKQTAGYINEVMNYAVNEAKWDTAKLFCDAHGWKFIIITEQTLSYI